MSSDLNFSLPVFALMRRILFLFSEEVRTYNGIIAILIFT